MGLEAGNGFISGLVSTNPVGATDPKSQGDDHIRLLKLAVKGQFPNLGAAAVTGTAADLNQLTGAAALGVIADIAAFTDANADRIYGWDDSATAAIQFALSTGLTTSGTNLLIDTGVVPRLAANNIFTAVGSFGTPTITLSSALPVLGFNETDAAADNKVWALYAEGAQFVGAVANDASSVATNWLQITRSGTSVTEIQLDATVLDFNGAMDLSGNLTANAQAFIGSGSHAEYVATPVLGVAHATAPHVIVRETTNNVETIVSSISTAAYIGAVSNHPLILTTNNSTKVTIGTDGALTTLNLLASEIGYKGTPSNNQDGNYGLVLTDAGKVIYKAAGGAGETITIPANGSVAFPVGTIVRVVNNGGGALTIAITTDTLSLAGVGTTGSRTLSDHGVAVLEKVAATEWFISGVGVS